MMRIPAGAARSALGVSVALATAAALLVGCASSNQGTGLTLGQVQKSVDIGMSQAEVMEVLGPPNIVSTNADGNEVWAYDKVEKRSASRGFLFWGSGETSSRTMTVLLTFAPQGEIAATGKPDWRVAELKYHATQF